MQLLSRVTSSHLLTILGFINIISSISRTTSYVPRLFSLHLPSPRMTLRPLTLSFLRFVNYLINLCIPELAQRLPRV
ncbi:hypothetical protein BGW80DRAFT_805950 [Lactifluus volemus]|nr:hypothetical protein BGW80DRAFT_805950 [Lactifluus volemus]